MLPQVVFCFKTVGVVTASCDRMWINPVIVFSALFITSVPCASSAWPSSCGRNSTWGGGRRDSLSSCVLIRIVSVWTENIRNMDSTFCMYKPSNFLSYLVLVLYIYSRGF